MTELDFEELDKAVSDLMKDTDVEQPQAQGVPLAISTPSTPVALNDASQQAQSTQADSTPPLAATPVVPAMRRGGRFMDVKPLAGNAPAPVRPAAPPYNRPTTFPAVQTDEASISMAAELASLAAAQTPQANEEPKIENSTVGDYALNPAAEPIVPAEGSVPAAQANESESTNSASTFTMPDPIDVANNTEKTPEDELSAIITPEMPADSESIMAESGAVKSESTDDEGDDQHESGMDSPFLLDAKVEKRPLGGAPSEPSEDVMSEPGIQEQTPIAVAPLPRELGTDLMNLETDGNDVALAPGDDKKDVKDAAPAPDTQNVQVTPQPVADVKPTGGIYDTDTYHNMPIGAPVKKKHGWMVIVWILVLLIVGACAGAAYFYFTTQQ